MPKTIYHWENNSTEEWIGVNDDGTVSHHVENSGWPMARGGAGARDRIMSAAEAKQRWPARAEQIDDALRELGVIC